jgi:hypothetical protein
MPRNQSEKDPLIAVVIAWSKWRESEDGVHGWGDRQAAYTEYLDTLHKIPQPHRRRWHQLGIAVRHLLLKRVTRGSHAS